jgi:hypothetical protein
MPITNKKSDILSADPDSAKANGVLRFVAATLTNAADDLLGSKFKIASLPSCAVLDALTGFQVQNWGFADIRIGTAGNPAALVSVLKSAGNVVNPIARFDAKHGQPLWQALGLADDPGGMIDLYAHAIANATGAGSMKVEIAYRWRG